MSTEVRPRRLTEKLAVRAFVAAWVTIAVGTVAIYCGFRLGWLSHVTASLFLLAGVFALAYSLQERKEMLQPRRVRTWLSWTWGVLAACLVAAFGAMHWIR